MVEISTKAESIDIGTGKIVLLICWTEGEGKSKKIKSLKKNTWKKTTEV